MAKLSVNINKIATIRNARGGNTPSVVQVALDCERFGAEGITVHPRPDERHITKQDVYDLAKVVTTEFNIEGYPDQRYLDLIQEMHLRPFLDYFQHSKVYLNNSLEASPQQSCQLLSQYSQ